MCSGWFWSERGFIFCAGPRAWLALPGKGDCFMAIKSYRILNLLPCVSGGKKLRVVAAFDQEIGDLLPYFNAVLERATYDHVRGTLTTCCYGRPVILSSRHVVIGQLTYPGLAEEILEVLKDFLNRVLEQKDKIAPIYEAKIDPIWQQIFISLPRTNCAACGEQTCMAFALKLWSGEQLPEHCSALEQPEMGKIQALLDEINDPLLP